MRDNQKKKFAQKLLELRKSLGLSQEAFARKIGVPPRSYQNMEQSKTTRIEMEALAALRALGFNVDAFLGKRTSRVAAPEPEEPPSSPGLTATTMRKIALDDFGAITEYSVPKQVRANEQFLYEFGAWTRRMLILNLDCQPQIVKRFKELMADFERELEEKAKDENPPGLPAGAERNQGGGRG